MSDNPLMSPGRDSRPEWLLDPTIADIDEDAITQIGQDLQQRNVDAMSSQFISRGMEHGQLPAPDPATQAPLAPPLAGQWDYQAPTTDPAPAPAPAPGTQDAPPQPTPAPPDSSQGLTQASSGAPATGTPQPGGGAPEPLAEIPLRLPDGQMVTLTTDQVMGLMQNYQWFSSRPQEVLQAWGGIEQGTHHAVPNTEYAEFTRWKAAQGIAQAVGRRPAHLDDMDPDVAEYVQRLEAQAFGNAQGHVPVDAPGLPGAPGVHPVQQGPYPTQPGQPGQPMAPVSAADLAAQQAAAVQRQVRLTTSLDEVRNEMASTYGLTPEQVDLLAQEVTNARIVPAISMKHSTRNFMGQVIAEADPTVVFREAFEATMATHPTFRQIRDEAVYNRRLQQDSQLTQAVASKKAAAGSLAHTPSAAVPVQGNGQVDPTKMTPQQLQQAMVEELRQLMASGEAAN